MSTFSESDMYQAAEHLARTEKGRGALEGLAAFFEHGYSLDSTNQEACLKLIQGFFGSWTGSAVDAVRSSISENE